MGTLLGHALPGSFFLLFSLWRLVQTIRRLQIVRAARRWSLLGPYSHSHSVEQNGRTGTYHVRPYTDKQEYQRLSQAKGRGGINVPSHRASQAGGLDSRNSMVDGKWMYPVHAHTGQQQKFPRASNSEGLNDPTFTPSCHLDEQRCHLDEPIVDNSDVDNAQLHNGNYSSSCSDPGDYREYSDIHQLMNKNLTSCYSTRDDIRTIDDICSKRNPTNTYKIEKSWQYYTSASYPCYFGCFSRLPLEPIFKILVTTVGMAGELGASTDWGQQGRIRWMGDIQHVTMYSLFFISGLVDLLLWFNVSCIPRGLDFLALAQAFLGEYLLFRGHNHSVDEFEQQLHSRLCLIIAATVPSILLELKYSKSLTPSLCSTFLIFLQGTWFIQVGLILYPPVSDWFMAFSAESSLKPDEQLVLGDMIFAWHVGIDFVALCIVFVMISKLFDMCCVPSKYEAKDTKLVEKCAAEFNSISHASILKCHLVTSRERNDSERDEQCCHDNREFVANGRCCRNCRSDSIASDTEGRYRRRDSEDDI